MMGNGESGIAGIFLLLFILLLLMGGIFGADAGYIYYTTHCEDTGIVGCLTAPPASSPTPLPETTVTASGSVGAKGYSVAITMNVPLEGGKITGSFSGDCQGNITGTVTDGIVRGTARGSCNPFMVPIPAQATFTGTIDSQAKTIPLNGSGSAAGFSGDGSVTLTF